MYSLFALLDGINTTIDNSITIPPTNTKIRPILDTNTTTTTTTTITITTTTNTNMNMNMNMNANTNTKTTRMQPKDQQVPIIWNNNTNKKKKKKKQATPPKTKTRTTHEIKQLIVTVNEVNQYLQHVQKNSELDEFPMNNPTIRTQIVECEVAYYKIQHTNPVLEGVDMEFYHSLPPVQVLLGEMTRLESLALRLDATASDTTTTTTKTFRLNVSNTNKDTIPTIELSNNTTVTATTTTTTTTITTAITTPKPTVDQTHPRNCTEKDTAGTPATTNNNNNTTDNQAKADDNHIPGPSNHLLTGKNIGLISTFANSDLPVQFKK